MLNRDQVCQRIADVALLRGEVQQRLGQYSCEEGIALLEGAGVPVAIGATGAYGMAQAALEAPADPAGFAAYMATAAETPSQ